LIELATTPLPAKRLNAWLYALSQRVPCERVFVSHYLQRVLRQSGEVIPNFVAPVFLDVGSTSAAVARGSGTVRIGWVGTSAPNKGGDFFVDVCHAVASSAALSALVVEFTCATTDERLRRALSSQPVIVTSPMSDVEMQKFYRSCDVVLSLSISEGFGLPVLEAMASGCPVVCTDSGGVTDFVQDGVTGLLVTDRSVSEVVAAIERLLLEPGLSQRLSRDGRLMAQRYSFDRFAEGYTKLFSRLGLLNDRNALVTPSAR
jgi:glycosyltransferase involved in cell wall biosynthesis